MVINEKRTINHFVVVAGLISIEVVRVTTSTLVLVAVLVLIAVLVLVMVLVAIGAGIDIVVWAATLVTLTTSRPVVLLVGSWVVVVLGSRRGSTDVHQVTISLTLSTKTTWHLCWMMVLASVAQRVRSGVWFLGWVLGSRWSSSNHIVSSLALLVA